MSIPKITIVTPSYNQGRYLEQTIQSVLAQNYPELEYIVIDGGSSDNSVDILQRYANNLSYYVSEPDNGQTHAINKGFAKSTGDIMGWLNSDDLLMPDALWTIAKHFQQYPDTAVVTGLRRTIDASSEFVRNELLWMPEVEVIKRGAFIAQETTYWKRQLWEEIGPLDEAFYFSLDYDFWQRIIHAGYTFSMIPAYLGIYRVHEDAKSSAAIDTRMQELCKIYQHYGIANDEPEALAQLNDIIGASWRHKQRMLKEFGEKSLSHNPRNFMRYFALLQAPLIGTLLVEAHRAYNRLRKRPVY